MRLIRRATSVNRGDTELTPPEGANLDVYFPGGGKMVATFKGHEGSPPYEYTMHLTIRDVASLFMTPLAVRDSERELWGAFFKLWIKRVKKRFDP